MVMREPELRLSTIQLDVVAVGGCTAVILETAVREGFERWFPELIAG